MKRYILIFRAIIWAVTAYMAIVSLWAAQEAWVSSIALKWILATIAMGSLSNWLSYNRNIVKLKNLLTYGVQRM